MLKWIGAILIVIGSGSFGLTMVLSHKREAALLQQLLEALNYMQCELQYRMLSLPDLFLGVADIINGDLGALFRSLSAELHGNTLPKVSACMSDVLERTPKLPDSVKRQLQFLGDNLGQFGIDGQMMGLESSKRSCISRLEHMTSNQEVRLRSYQTLGLCAGAALVILFI